MHYHLYATRPVRPGQPPATAGRPTVHRRGQRDHLLITQPAFAAPYALTALLFHAERRTFFWVGRGWADAYRPEELEHELWECDAQGAATVPVARVTADDRLIAAHGFIQTLPHRSLTAALSTYTANAKVLTGRPPRRSPQLTCTAHEGEHLLAVEGAIA
ncbi:hypothetical protein ACFPC0_10735 [Streptomyces andamanensis]|uniref:Uncharacterized protein n=1 Tax=Streptomyces andamanensis TaxID=1565035 RepID=A0ABV8TCF8_9ACTN